MRTTLPLLLALAACNSSGGTSDMGAGMDLTTTATVTERGTVIDLSSKNPVANLQVCLYSPMLSPQPCATTGADGTYSLPGIPASTQVAASLTGGAYYPSLYLKTTGAADETNDIEAISSGTITLLTAVVNVQADPTNPPPDGGTGPAHNSGISVALTPSSGSGPFYLDATGIPQMVNKQSMTSAKGVGAYINVDPGVVELTYTAPAGITCAAPIAGWPGSTPSSIKALVVAGYGTAAYMTCK